VRTTADARVLFDLSGTETSSSTEAVTVQSEPPTLLGELLEVEVTNEKTLRNRQPLHEC